jgi:hypothetical protein
LHPLLDDEPPVAPLPPLEPASSEPPLLLVPLLVPPMPLLPPPKPLLLPLDEPPLPVAPLLPPLLAVPPLLPASSAPLPASGVGATATPPSISPIVTSAIPFGVPHPVGPSQPVPAVHMMPVHEWLGSLLPVVTS